MRNSFEGEREEGEDDCGDFCMEAMNCLYVSAVMKICTIEGVGGL
jgi:hypothetical protein